MIGAPELILLVAGLVGYETLVRLRLDRIAGRIGRVGFEARATMSSTDLEDDEKERRVRAMAGSTLADTARLALRIALVAAACAAVIWLGSSLAGTPADRALDRAASWQGLLGLSVAVTAWALLRRGLGRPGRPGRPGSV